MLWFNKVSNQELVDFTKNLSVMLHSGITIDQALTSLISQAQSSKLRRVLQQVRQEVQAGNSLTTALAKEPKIFGRIFISLTQAGEASGTLEKNLEYLADWLERNNNLRRDINAALLYPKIIVSATLIIGGGLAIFILPRLTPLFRSLRVELPLATRVLMAIAFFAQSNWLLLVILIFLIVAAFYLLNSFRPTRKYFHLFYIRMPIFGRLNVNYQLALICQLFATLFNSGLPINRSLDITSDGATNLHYQDTIFQIKNRVAQGTPLTEALRAYPKLYPATMINIIATGEKGGTLDHSFVYLADYYIREVNNQVKRLPSTIEPILLIFIGLAVGFVAIAIITPIYELTQGIEQQIR